MTASAPRDASEDLPPGGTLAQHDPAETILRPSDAYVQSFARGLAVIRSFNAQRPSQTLSEVAQATGLTRAGARRILLTLQTLGYVAVEGRDFRLTPKILDLGFTYLTSLPFWDQAEPILESLSAKVQESVSAAVRDGDDIVYVLRVPMQRIMTINLAIGSRLPAYCTSMGRVLLAGLGDLELDQWLSRATLTARTHATCTDPNALRAAIVQVRAQGWALVDQELEPGLISLSVALRDRRGRTIAAMNISANAQRKGPDQLLGDYLQPLLAASADITRLISSTR